MTIPIDVVVTDAMDYSAIIRNDWLAKEGNEIEVPIEYLEMPIERRKKLEKQIRKKEEKDESEVEEEENDEEEIEEEESNYEKYEEENLDEKVFCHYQMKRKTQYIRKQHTSLQLTCQFSDIVTAGVYPKENFMLIKGGVSLDESFYHWDYFSRLDKQFKRKAPRKATWDYDWKGPSARCWCGNRLYSPSDECSQCLRELTNYITVQRLPPSIITEMSSKADIHTDIDDLWEITPSEVQIEEVTQIVDEQDHQRCFYCGRLSQIEWEQKKETPLYFGHCEVQPNKADQLSGLPMGQLTNEQKSALIDLLERYQHLFAWESTQLGRTDLVRHTIDVGGAAPIKKRWY
ncbi:unnamed protein product [Rhizophagus irregularis]|nr:unnamed protein product [Rhizophagus irregularis]